MFNRRFSFAALAALVLIAAGSVATIAAQGRGGGGGGKGGGGTTLVPTIATFADEAIRVADGDPILDGEDGVKSIRAVGSSSTNGWSWNLDEKRTRTPRSLIYDLTNPADETSPPFGVVEVHDTHGQTYDLSTIADGGEALVRASFHLVVEDTLYVVRFGQNPDDGSSPLRVTRTGDTFWVRTDAGTGDVARLMLGNGPGEVLLGYYHVPFSVVLESQ
jgi:hypothetical protein